MGKEREFCIYLNKSTMKTLFSSIFVTTLCVSLLVSCKKGDAGPAGEPGPAGPVNAIQFNFAPFAHSGAEVTKTFNLSKVEFDKSLLYVYVTPGNSYWYPLPGTTAGASKDYRIYFGNPTPTTTNIYVSRIAGTGSETLTMRIVVIPAATQVNALLFKKEIMNDYQAVAQFYGLR